MLSKRHHRTAAWLTLASYVLASVTAALFHEHSSHAAADGHGRVSSCHLLSGHLSNGHWHGASSAAVADARHACSTQAIVSDNAAADNAAAASDPGFPSHEDSCLICQFLGQVPVSEGATEPAMFCRLVTTLASAAPLRAAGDFCAEVHSRGPPRLA